MTDFERRLMQALGGRMFRGTLRDNVGHHAFNALAAAVEAKIYTSLKIWAPLSDLCIDIEERNRAGGLPHG